MSEETPQRFGRGARWMWLVPVLGLAVRLVHNSAMMGLPLYFFPIGGHVAFLDAARSIAHGMLLPSRVFTENSPLYPYLLAPQFYLFGDDNYLLPRLVTIVLDCGTLCFIMLIARRLFGNLAGLFAGIIYGVYGPAVFFADELIYTSYALLFLTAAVWCLLLKRWIAAGLLFAAAVLVMPSLVLCAPLFLLTPMVMKERRSAKAAALFCGALLLGIAPCAVVNYVASGELVILTASAGHNFYIGHNPQAQAGYFLPDRVGELSAANRGSIFDSMKNIAEEVEGRPLRDSEVSPYYFHKALAAIREDPVREGKLLFERLLALLNSYEATTYSSYRFAAENSPLLRFLPPFEFFSGLAVLGILCSFNRRVWPLYVPILGSALSVFAFFYLARFRMPMIPVLAVFAGYGLAQVLESVKLRKNRSVMISAVICLMFYFVGKLPLVEPSAANEWNKLGYIYKVQKQYERAEQAFRRAREEDPAGENSYRNLAALYKVMGRSNEAFEMETEAKRLAAPGAGARFENDLRN